MDPLRAGETGEEQQQLRLMRWFNNTIYHNDCGENLHSINLNQINDSLRKFDRIWISLLQLASDESPYNICHLNSKTVENSKRASSQMVTWASNLTKSVLANYQTIWLKAFYTAYLEKQHLQTSMVRVESMSEQKVIKEISKMSFEKLTSNLKHIAATVVASLIMAIYWLDQAKLDLILPNDPCLFKTCNSSAEVLQKLLHKVFLPERVARVKCRLKAIGVNVIHIERQMDRIDFRIKSLSSDLADGIRLARIIQIMFPGTFKYLWPKLKYPAEKKSVRVENLQLIFRECATLMQHYDHFGFQWSEQRAMEIADNHRMPTLQIIESLMRVHLALLIQQRYLPQLDQIIKLQKWIRNQLLTKKLRKQFFQLRMATIWVQKNYRNKLEGKKQRNQYLRLRTASLIIQRWFRRRKYWRLAKNHVECYLNKRKQAATTIQRFWRGYCTRIRCLVQHPRIYLIGQKLDRLGSNPTNQMNIANKSMKILKRLVNNNHRKQSMLSDQDMNDIDHLLKYCAWSREVCGQLLSSKQWPDLFASLNGKIFSMNRSEQHKLCAYNIVGIFYWIVEHQLVRNVNQNNIQMEQMIQVIPALIHVMHNHINHAPLIISSLSLMDKILAYPLDVADQRFSQFSPKWQRLVKRIINRYRIVNNINDFIGDCDHCQTIQSLIVALNKQISHK